MQKVSTALQVMRMPAKTMDGRKIAGEVLAKVRKEVAELAARSLKPKLVVIQVGNDPASTVYVNKKHETCVEAGMDSAVIRLPANVSYEKLVSEVERLNEDKNVHGILVQLPLPEHLRHKDILEKISVQKDVDGLHPYNHGKNLLGKEGFQPATPIGIMELLKSTGTNLEGKNAVVIGRSNIVGKPTALMLLNAGCTVTVCHSKTKNLSGLTKKADILVSAVGKPGLVKQGMVKKGAIVIDVGTTRLPNGKLSGDVDFVKVSKIAGWITPVPGGVGPMTIACLMQNTIKACRQQAKAIEF